MKNKSNVSDGSARDRQFEALLQSWLVRHGQALFTWSRCDDSTWRLDFLERKSEFSSRLIPFVSTSVSMSHLGVLRSLRPSSFFYLQALNVCAATMKLSHRFGVVLSNA